jgi:hypothetical protein
MIATDDRGEWSPEECAQAAAQASNARAGVITAARSLPSLEDPKETASLISSFLTNPH